MRATHILPYILTLLPLSQVLAQDLNDELIGLSMRDEEIADRMPAFRARFEELAQAYVPAETWIRDAADPKNAKYAYPNNLKFWINDQWKFFRIIDEMGLDPRIQLNNQERQALTKLDNSKAWAKRVRELHCPYEPTENDRVAGGARITPDVLAMKKRCRKMTIQYYETWHNYAMKLDKIRYFRAIIHRWQEDPEWEAGLEYELKRMADNKMTNTDWMKWLTAEVEASSSKKKPAFDDAEYQRIRTNQATWADWSRFYMKYTRPANKLAPTGQLEFNTPEERKIADAYVKKRLTWQYHRKMVGEFLAYFDSALPDDSEHILNVQLEVQDQIDDGRVPTAVGIKDDILTEFRELDNEPERDPKFHFKKAKGLDAKLAFIANKPSIGRFVNEDFTDRTAQEALKVMQNIEKAYDPKLHPRGKAYMISDLMRRKFGMPERKINGGPMNMNAPAVRLLEDDEGPNAGRQGAPLNPGNNRKFPKVKNVM